MIFSFMADKLIKTADENSIFDICTEIVVAGLGTAGSIAAIYAAENGADVIGIERTNVIGGASTLGCIWDYYYGSYGGLGDEICAECSEIVKMGFLETYKGSDYDSYSEAVRTYVLEKRAQRSGCRLMYETAVIGVFLDNNRVCGVKCICNGKIINIGCKAVIDSTGDCFVSRLAGARVINGRYNDGVHMVSSNPAARIYEGKIFSCWTHYSTEDTTDEKTLSRMIINSGANMPFLQPRFDDDSRLLYISSVPGERSTVQIEADEMILFDDYCHGYRTDKPIFYGFAQLDDCNFDVASSSDYNQDWRLTSSLYYYGISLGIPLASLLPKGIEGVIVACKGIGIDYDLLGCVRMRKNLEKCGEAAAAAALMAVKQGVSFRDIKYEKLAAILRKSGCLDEKNNVGLCDLSNPIDKKTYSRIALPHSIGEIKDGLSKPIPRLAFWAARISEDDELIKEMRRWCCDENRILAENSSIALAMKGDSGIRQNLAAIVQNIPRVNKPEQFAAFEYQPFISALCLLGRIGEESDLKLLVKTAENAEEISKRFPYGQRQYFSFREDWEFLILSIALESIMKISARVGCSACDEWLEAWLDEAKCPEFSRKSIYKYSIKNNVERYFKDNDFEKRFI